MTSYSEYIILKTYLNNNHEYLNIYWGFFKLVTKPKTSRKTVKLGISGIHFAQASEK